MADGLIIRPGEAADHSGWTPLWDGYNRFYERRVAAGVTAMTWSRFFDAHEPVHALVAERDGRLVGLAHYLYHRNTATIAPTCCLQDLFTDPAARGARIGRALIEAVYERAGIAGSPRVYWMTHETNHTAMRLYDAVADRSGFVQYPKQI